MTTKENKGGFLRNDQVEQDLGAKGKTEGAYEGAQDTGDKLVRQTGTEVQQNDGMPQTADENGEN